MYLLVDICTFTGTVDVLMVAIKNDFSVIVTNFIHPIGHIQRVWALGILSQGHMGAPLYHYTSQVGHRFLNSRRLVEWKWYHNIMIEAWYPPWNSSYIHIKHIWCELSIGTLSQGHMVAPLYCFIGQVGLRFGTSGSLEEWKWYHNVKVEANTHLRTLHTSILF
jgi:hypothetical protein